MFNPKRRIKYVMAMALILMACGMTLLCLQILLQLIAPLTGASRK